MKSTTVIGLFKVRLSRKDPTKIAGQNLKPNIINPAAAKPLAGQKGDALLFIEANCKPKKPNIKYIEAIKTNFKRSFFL